MGTGLPLIDIGLGVATFVGIALWMLHLTTRPRAPRRQRAVARTSSRQPWDNDKDGGRGNR